MPTFSLSHEENRGKVCVVCLLKGTRLLSAPICQLISMHLFDKFEKYSDLLPCAICDTCRIHLASRANSDQTQWKQLPPCCNYKELIHELTNLTAFTRAHSVCVCTICNAGRAKMNPQLPQKTKRGRPRTTPPPVVPQSITLCTKCKGLIHKGITHKCTEAEKYNNVDGILSPHTKELIASRYLREKMSASGSNSVSLITRAKPLLVESAVSRAKKKLDFSLSHDTMVNMQIENNWSDRETLRAARGIRQGGGDVKPHLREAIVTRGRVLSEHFVWKHISQIIKDASGKAVATRRVAILVKDPNALVDYLVNERGIGDQKLVRVGMDGGGGFLKVCLNVMSNSEQSQTASPVKKRAHKFKDSGVKKLLIIGIIQETTENYDNVREILRLLNLNTLHFCLAADLKLCNILAGLQNHAAMYPCTWCEARAPFDQVARQRTLGRIRKMAQAYRNAGSVLRTAKDFFNCVHSPLLSGDDSLTLLELIPPPELHLLLGVANKLLDELNAKWGEDQGYQWAKDKGIVRVSWRGGSMEGNQSKKFLEKTEDLYNVLPDALKPFAVAAKAFNKVRVACFGMNLEANYSDAIEEFRQCYLELDISVTPKVHCVFQHVREFCYIVETGLGQYSEQASESVHADWAPTYQRYQRPMDHNEYPEKLLAAVVKYNSNHI
jgi:hypothetical protein